VYIIDTGLRDEHMAFEGRATRDADCSGAGNCEVCNGADTPTCGQDYAGHGTHAAGTVAGKLVGVADQASLHCVKVFTMSGLITPGWSERLKWSTVMRAIDWVIHNAVQPAVISMSLGTYHGDAEIKMRSEELAVGRAVEAGITVVVAGGNKGRKSWDKDGGDACRWGPASVSDAITVSSVDEDDLTPHAFNFDHFCVDIRAPGKNILSTYSMDESVVDPEDACHPNACVRFMAGTSMAAPHVAGAAAILLGNEASLSPAEVKKRLLDTASDLTKSGFRQELPLNVVNVKSLGGR